MPDLKFSRPSRRTRTTDRATAALACGLVFLSIMAGFARAADAQAAFGNCYARLTGDRLEIGNAAIHRAWRVAADGSLTAVSLRHGAQEIEWIADGKNAADAAAVRAAEPSQLELRTATGQAGVTEEPSLQATLRVALAGGHVAHRFQVFGGAPAISLERTVELDPGAPPLAEPALAALNRLEAFTPAPAKFRFTRVLFHAQTDLFEGPLAVDQSWEGMPTEDDSGDARLPDAARFRGNVFFVEDAASGAGVLFLKHAPLPNERPRAIDAAGKVVNRLFDATVRERHLELTSHEVGAAGGNAYRHATIAYSGGRAGRIAALQSYHRQLRTYVPGRDGLLLCNAWGEWNSSQNLSPAFLEQEVPAAARLGVDVFQVDAGWQNGTYPEPLDRKKRAELGMYGINPNYWGYHQGRFPDGIKRHLDHARSLGMIAGIWFAPDPFSDFVNWQKDKARVLELYLHEGARYFKFDLLRIYTPLGEHRLHGLIDELLRETNGGIVIDLDVTGAYMPRPGYFGNPHHGPIFVENRWTHYPMNPPMPNPNEYWPRKDRWWPHRTLRNFWLLAQYVDPIRLRMEFMNNLRNQHIYGDDPLAPAKWSPAYIFATVMFSSPLAWMEVQHLPEAYVRNAAPLIALWKQHRDAMFSGSILPVGEQPDGHSWTGFFSANAARDGGYALIFREENTRHRWETELPLLGAGDYDVTRLAGDGYVTADGGKLTAEIMTPRQFVFVKLRRK